MSATNDLPDYICDYCGGDAYSQRLDKTSGQLKYVCSREFCRSLSKPLRSEQEPKSKPTAQANQTALW